MTQAVCISKRFKIDRGYAFLARNGEPDIFLHRSVLTGSGFSSPPAAGDKVVVEYERREKGLEATSVISIERKSAPDPTLDVAVPARVKFYDWRRGFGFVNLFGAPDRDLHISADCLTGFDDPPHRGEAVAICLDEASPEDVSRVAPWIMVDREAGDPDA